MQMLKLDAQVLVCLLAMGTVARGETDPRFTKVENNDTTGKIVVDFRLSGPETVVKVEGWAEEVKVADGTFVPFDDIPDSTTAYAFVVDVSNPARRATIKKCAQAAVALIETLNERAKVAVFSLGSSVKAEAPFESSRAEIKTVLQSLQPDGDQTKATLIYSGCKGVIQDHLARQQADRKVLVVFTDGKDETGKGKPDEAQIQRLKAEELVAEALKQQVVIHSIGYAETPTELNELDNINDVARKAFGTNIAAASGSGALPDEFVQRFPAYLSSGGRAEFPKDVFAGKRDFFVKIMTDSGKEHQVPESPLAAQVAPATVPPVVPGVIAPDPAVTPAGSPAIPTTPVSDGTISGPQTPVESDSASGKWMNWALAGTILFLCLLIFIFLSRSKAKAKIEAEIREAELKRIDEDMRTHPHFGTETDEEVIAPPAAILEPLAWLEMLDSNQSRVPITQASVRMGRAKEDEVHIKNDSVSRSHCAVKRTGDGSWVVIDLESGNGVFLNGKRIEQSMLKDGDVIELGEVKMRFVLED